MPISDYEAILVNWNLMPSYRRHRNDLHDLALQYYLRLCYLNRGRVITREKYLKVFKRYLEVHPLFAVTILQREKPHIPPDMYQTLSECLACYIVAQDWAYIISHSC